VEPEPTRPRSLRAGLWAYVAVCAVLGAVQRLSGLDRSLWLDEFGTLWTVEAGAVEAWGRALAFQGQSPLYYLLVAAFVGVLGESEVVLRLPSLLAGAATAGVAYRLGRAAGGTREDGALAGALVWICPALVAVDRFARPYALAVLLLALLLDGYLRAARGERGGRLQVVLSGAGLFYAHYVLALGAAGLAVAHALRPESRERYPWRSFLVDAALQVALVAPALPHLAELLARRRELLWLRGSPAWALPALMIGPYLPAIAAGLYLRLRRGQGRASSRAPVTLLLVLAAHGGGLLLLAALGPDLLTRRYLVPLALPAAVLAAWGLSSLLRGLGGRGGRVVLLASLALFPCWRLILPSRAMWEAPQDWRRAVALLEPRIAREPGPVLYRSGFVEEDGWVEGDVGGAVLAPLRSPGRPRPDWEVVPLTNRWNLSGRERYFERRVAPAIADAETFYLLATGPAAYARAVVDWVERRFPGRFRVEEIEWGTGLAGLVFRARG